MHHPRHLFAALGCGLLCLALAAPAQAGPTSQHLPNVTGQSLLRLLTKTKPGKVAVRPSREKSAGASKRKVSSSAAGLSQQAKSSRKKKTVTKSARVTAKVSAKASLTPSNAVAGKRVVKANTAGKSKQSLTAHASRRGGKPRTTSFAARARHSKGAVMQVAARFLPELPTEDSLPALTEPAEVTVPIPEAYGTIPVVAQQH